ncbi:MAG: hypothetical protein HY290_29545 [Planctomycetia bacterium]|nr:hypothetical protein [Planctomycetia bacterium]
MVDVHECKDTAITKDDRLTFYDRLRRELAAGTAADRIRPVWVTDPGKQTENALTYLEGMAAKTDLDLPNLLEKSPERVDSIEDAIQEAVHRLLHFSGEVEEKAKVKGNKRKKKKREWPRPCTVEEVRTLLKNIRIARHTFGEFDQAIKPLTTGVFASGTVDSIQTFVTGVLTERVVQKGTAEFTVEEFLQAVGTTSLEHGITGLVRDLCAFGAAAGLKPEIRRITWRNLPESPTSEWTLHERVPEYQSSRSCCLVADMGVGKTVASQLAFEHEASNRHPGRTLRFESRALDDERLEALLRLACMFCGVGPTWIAIDGLDEAPHEMRTQFLRVIGALVSLPNLTFLATVRREVFVVQEWLADAVLSLPRIEMRPLSTEQVERSFSDVGMPIPMNPQLISVLQNPFLLSLYANIVAPQDMPLAISGEVTAMLVIEEFWGRRVRGASLGQRLVGVSETSQERKRKAAAFLGERTLSGDLAIVRTSDDPHVVEGIEMLLREGVLREQGASTVAWSHELLREYSLMDTLLSRCPTASAVDLARQIVSTCSIDQVARLAATGGLKWVLSNKLVGGASEFLSELWNGRRGLARAALVVLLEGPASAGVLSELPDDLLAEALTWATSLGAPHWGGEVAGLQESRFFGTGGDGLHAVAVEYELKTACRPGMPSFDTMRRLTVRDLKRWNEGHPPYLNTAVMLLENILECGGSTDEGVAKWLVKVAGVSSHSLLGRICDAVERLLATGANEAALAMYRAMVGLGDAQRGDPLHQSIAERKFAYERPIVKILQRPGLLAANVATWGATALEFLAGLVNAKQKSDWPSHFRFMKAIAKRVGSPQAEDQEFVANYDEDPRASTFHHVEDHAVVHVRQAIEQAFCELAALEDATAFRILADLAVNARFAAVAVIPLLVLKDSGDKPESKKGWHSDEVRRLVSHPDVAGLVSLEDVRRLLRRRLYDSTGSEAKVELVEAIRRADLPSDAKTREMSDLIDWGVLSDTEIVAIAASRRDGLIFEPVEPRDEQLHRIDHRPRPSQQVSKSGWPYSDEEDLIRALQAAGPSSGLSLPLHPASGDFARQLEALRVLLGRPEATEPPWLGQFLSWCSKAVESLRRFADPDPSPARMLTAGTWRETLDQWAPWWPALTELALGRLVAPVPIQHADREFTGDLAWGSDDPIFGAAAFLDDLLAIDPGPPFASLQQRTTAEIASVWAGWPSFTKATILLLFRPWYFHKLLGFRAILNETVKSEANPIVMQYAVDRIVQLPYESPVPELAILIARAKSGEFGESLRTVAQHLGAAAIFHARPGPSLGVVERKKLLETVFASDWRDTQPCRDLLRGVLFGAKDAVVELEDERTRLYDAWLILVSSIVERWPFDSERASLADQFPSHAIFEVVEIEQVGSERTRLFLGLADALVIILSREELDTFCQLHLDLNAFITGRSPYTNDGTGSCEGLRMTGPVEQKLLALCRASVSRVVQWSREGKTTNDLAWGSGLSGADSVELIRLCLDVSKDRVTMKRELVPLVDDLAGAGQPRLAADLGVHLRYA